MTEDIFVFGRNPVFEAIKMDLPVKKVFLANTLKGKEEIESEINALNLDCRVKIVDKGFFRKIDRSERSSGIAAELMKPEIKDSIEFFVEFLERKHPKPLLLAVDSIQDPRNFGAIIRSAVGAGFHGVIFPGDRQVGITGIVASSSAGACFRMPMCRVVNLARALDYIKEKQYTVYGADMDGCVSFLDGSFVKPLALIVGSEGKGMRDQVKKRCDEIYSIPLQGGLESLNASVAAGIAMFAISKDS